MTTSAPSTAGSVSSSASGWDSDAPPSTESASLQSSSDDDDKDTSNTGAIAGGVVGGVLGLFAISGAAIMLMKQRKKKLRDEAEYPEMSVTR